jgi:hypothetical protein
MPAAASSSQPARQHLRREDSEVQIEWSNLYVRVGSSSTRQLPCLYMLKQRGEPAAVLACGEAD